MLITESTRLFLRHLHIGDLDAMAAIFADPEGDPLGSGPQSRQRTQRWIERALDCYYRDWGFGPWAVIHKADRRLIGFCGLDILEEADGRREIELGYRFARPYWGQGLATEAAGAVVRHAFDEMSLDRLISSIDPRNSAALRVAAKIGMSYEREAERADGRRVQIYAIQRH
jgi:ribosomal-protein-alanine N-acetyltransferase